MEGGKHCISKVAECSNWGTSKELYNLKYLLEQTKKKDSK